MKHKSLFVRRFVLPPKLGSHLGFYEGNPFHSQPCTILLDLGLFIFLFYFGNLESSQFFIGSLAFSVLNES